ncbi:TPA: DUF2591 family protein [Pseudomonas aeruginosa]|uniref:phage protein NinX family protein n=1 Tax=Pseudomonas aeruginosa TaxID=287 RepID=UPI0003B9DD67|nr:phage protein NinX family protein [Pseudomonas aeruginosa]ERV86752.1 hypothetical protein Q041_02509 [Pseudomonas aeruginosa BWHPSA028]MBG6817941.1 DUF2591 family protein [Pseudomonas aeruginosa]MEA8561181.1 DUF2591 family protein [Pseudomonas aeruginosa]MEA8599652.1 DUF2591 family protein [Pseudomonas aeruginosa]MEA8605967.1 DUF2591 family protein [Pseudomonas aeruginosa]
MNETVEVKTCDLEGPALDWAVAHATKAWEWAHEWFPTMTLDPTFIRVVARECPRGPHGALVVTCLLEPRNPFRQDPQPFNPSTDWSQGGPLIEKYRFEFEWVGSDWHGEPLNFFTACGFDMPADATSAGPTHLIAACRAIVRAKYGKTVSVPAELIK